MNILNSNRKKKINLLYRFVFEEEGHFSSTLYKLKTVILNESFDNKADYD